MPLTANEIWRDFNTDGVPASGAHKPIKADIRAWGTQFEAAGGFNAPGADTTAALFSMGAGVPSVFRKIVGFDLPNPSTTTPGAVFAKPTVAGQVLTGLGADGEFETGSFTATNPNFTGGISINNLPFIANVSGNHVFYSPEGRFGINLTPTQNQYRATTHSFRTADGSVVAATINTAPNTNTLQLTPPTLTTGQTAEAINVTQTWNTDLTVDGVVLRFIAQAQGPLSSALRIRAGTAGTKEMFSVGIGDPTNPFITMNGRTVFGAPDGNSNFMYSATGGVSFINASGGSFLTTISNAGVWNFQGSTSGAHAVSAPAVASGASTWPTTSGEILNTGKGVIFQALQSSINLNAANNDNPITFPVVPGVRFWRIGSATAINVGPLANPNIVTYGIFGAAAGGAPVYSAGPNGMSALNSNTPGTPGMFLALSLGTLPSTLFNAGTTVYFRTLTAQGAAASMDIEWQITGYP